MEAVLHFVDGVVLHRRLGVDWELLFGVAVLTALVCWRSAGMADRRADLRAGRRLEGFDLRLWMEAQEAVEAEWSRSVEALHEPVVREACCLLMDAEPSLAAVVLPVVVEVVELAGVVSVRCLVVGVWCPPCFGFAPQRLGVGLVLGKARRSGSS